MEQLQWYEVCDRDSVLISLVVCNTASICINSKLPLMCHAAEIIAACSQMEF